LFLWAPISLILVKGLTPGALARLMDRSDLIEGLWHSLVLAVVSSIGACALGTATAFALPRMPTLARRLTETGLVFPMLLPEIAFGLALMTWFLNIGLTLGWGSLALGHIAFCYPYATLVMKAQVESIDRATLEAARDLGAGRWMTFRHGLLPQILPGLAAAFLTSFSLSLDDFLISFFVKGIDQTTLPIQLYGMMKLGLAPEAYAITVPLLCVSFAAVLASQIWLARSRRSAR